MVQIEIKRTGFPVKIGNIELWFDSSAENLRNFFNIEEIAEEKLKEAQEKAEHIHFPEGIENYELDEKDVEKIDAAFDVSKEFVAAQYDILFGDGTFKMIYEEYPDVIALERALVPLGEKIAERIGEMEKEREEEFKEIEKQYLNKKKAKRKK